VVSYMFGYGFLGQYHGDKEVAVDAGIATFINHGCRGQYNTGVDTGDLNEMTADEQQMPISLQTGVSAHAYNPVKDRNLHMPFYGIERMLRPVNAGDEILGNYIAMTGNPRDWEEDVLDLRTMCNGEGVGLVTEYETTHGPEK
jgi:hypothetical protein